MRAELSGIVVVSGLRDVAPVSVPDIELTMAEVLREGPAEIRFGGGRGSDTIALRASGEVRHRPTQLVVYAPCRAADLPAEARGPVSIYADQVVACRGRPSDPRSYLARNERMLEGAGQLVAFTDGRKTGGTAFTIRAAMRRGVPIRIVPVESAASRLANPEFTDRLDVQAPVVAVAPWARNWRSSVIKSLKNGCIPDKLELLAAEIATWLDTEAPKAIQKRRWLVPMPRRQPGEANDLLPLADLVADLRPTMWVLRDWLVRTEEPVFDAFIAYDRTRYPAHEHKRTLAVHGPPKLAGDVLLFDNVLTTSGTMVGAMQAVKRDTGKDVPGLAVLYAGDFLPSARKRKSP